MIVQQLAPIKTDNACFAEDFKNILQIADGIPTQRLLCVNPREGNLIFKMRENNRGLVIESFVSDDEWVDAAKTFSTKIYHGYSHHPLDSVEPGTFDMVLVCEDFAQVDDYDAMARAYYRLLKSGGALVCGIWNMRYHIYLRCILEGTPLPKDVMTDPMHGYGSIPIDTLTMRFTELGFDPINVYSLYGENADVSRFVEISIHNGEPAELSHFLTKTYFIKAVKS